MKELPMQHLAIFRLNPEASEEEQEPLRRPEAMKVWELIQEDVLRSVHFIPKGAVLHLETKDADEAEKYIKQLPMVRERLVSVELLPLRPYTGLKDLFGDAT
jgi:hypothetical protein